MKTDKKMLPLIMACLGLVLLLGFGIYLLPIWGDDDSQNIESSQSVRMSTDDRFGIDEMLKYREDEEEVLKKEATQGSALSTLSKIQSQQNTSLDAKIEESKNKENIYSNDEQIVDSLNKIFGDQANAYKEKIIPPKVVVGKSQKKQSKKKKGNVEESSTTQIIQEVKEDLLQDGLIGYIDEETTYIKEDKSSNSTPAGVELYSAKITGTMLPKNKVTYENNRVYILTKDPFYIQGVKIPSNTQLIAYAEFENELKLKIKRVKLGKRFYNCNIYVNDQYGQPSLEIMGGTGAKNKDQVGEDIGSEIASNETVQKVPGATSLINNWFKGKVKARVRSTQAFLSLSE